MSGNAPTTSSSQGSQPDIGELEAAAAAAPLDPARHSALALAYEAAGDHLKAATSRVAVQALTDRNAMILYNVATAYMNHAQLVQAERWFRVTLALDPELAVAHQNLASVLLRRGRGDEAAEHLKLAYSRQAVFLEPGVEQSPRVLLFCAGSIGNIPIKHLMADGRYTQIRYFVEYAREQELAVLPEHDVVFNIIGDPDVVASDHPTLDVLLARTSKTVLNAPAHVKRTRRDRLPGLLAGIEGAVTPAARRLDAASAGVSHADAIERDGPPYPVIVRPPATHGGQGVLLANSREELESHALAAAPSVYATAFHDYRSADGYFRKYRVIFVDGEPFPYHLAISEHWLVHYFSADMLKTPWKLEEERRFLEQPEQALGQRAYAALRAIGQRLELDYAGIDFSILPDGDLLVFEANATMLVHPEPATSALAHKNPHVKAIIEALAAMIERRRST